MKYCDVCDEEKGFLETICPNCGFKDHGAYMIKNTLVVAAVIIPIMILASISPDPGPDSNYTPKEETTAAQVERGDFGLMDKSSAYYACEQMVKKRLKKPSTAEFPRASGNKFQNTFKDGDGIQVHSYVDSENSYGATVRTGFSCWAEQPSEDNWVVKRLDMD